MLVLGATHDEGLDEVTRLDAPRGGRLLEARDPTVPGHGVLDARRADGLDRRRADLAGVTTLGGVIAVAESMSRSLVTGPDVRQPGRREEW